MSIENMLQRPGSYTEERLAILILLDRVDEENTEIREANAVLNTRQSKYKLDLDAAHSCIRELKQQVGQLKDHVLRLEIRAGYIAAGTGATAAGLFELVKWLMHR